MAAVNHPQAQELAAAYRQPLYPFSPLAPLKQLHMDDASYRAAYLTVKKPTTPSGAHLGHVKSGMPSTPTSFGDLENTTPRMQRTLEFSFDDRRASVPYGGLQTSY